jgi:phosphopantothenoylcysteine decarboxylase/phosphopantothenate--cysteine ligase
MLKDRTVVLGITGSIAAFKAADLASRLTQGGARVYTVMTPSAQEFITPLTIRSLTNQPVITDMFDPDSEFAVQHVALAQMADILVIAPATANIIAKLAHGLADDMLSLTVLATRAPVVLAPAMDADMYQNPTTQDNLAKLKSLGFTIIGPAYGRLASGQEGWGRLVETETILGIIRQTLGREGDLAGKRLVVTAGGTQEPLDPVRHLTNRSSGRMGYALAEAARDRGARALLIAAPTALPDPIGMELVKVRTAQEMRDAVMEATSGADALIMAAAVADFRPFRAEERKIKKGKESLALELTRTPDILQEARGNFLRVGFAAESENLVENATRKLGEKGLDLIVANQAGGPEDAFGTESSQVTIIDRKGKAESLPLLSKAEVAHRILDRVAEMLAETGKA